MKRIITLLTLIAAALFWPPKYADPLDDERLN